MFGIGTGEIAVLIVVGLVVFGPDRMRSFARHIGSWMTSLRREADAVRRDISDLERKGDEHDGA